MCHRDCRANQINISNCQADQIISFPGWIFTSKVSTVMQKCLNKNICNMIRHRDCQANHIISAIARLIKLRNSQVEYSPLSQICYTMQDVKSNVSSWLSAQSNWYQHSAITRLINYIIPRLNIHLQSLSYMYQNISIMMCHR